MDIIKRVVNGNILDGIFDIPEHMKNKKVLITISAYEDIENKSKEKSLRGSLEKYKNKELRSKE